MFKFRNLLTILSVLCFCLFSCDSVKPVAISEEEWNSAIKTLANRGEVEKASSNVVSRDGEEGKSSGSTLSTDKGFFITSKVEGLSKLPKADVQFMVSPDFSIQYQKDFKKVSVTDSDSEETYSEVILPALYAIYNLDEENAYCFCMMDKDEKDDSWVEWEPLSESEIDDQYKQFEEIFKFFRDQVEFEELSIDGQYYAVNAYFSDTSGLTKEGKEGETVPVVCKIKFNPDKDVQEVIISGKVTKGEVTFDLEFTVIVNEYIKETRTFMGPDGKPFVFPTLPKI